MTSLAELHRQYHQSLQGKREDLQRAWDALCDENAHLTQVEHLHLLLHRLAGSAGTYGYPDIATTARALEQVWSDWLSQAACDRPAAYQVCAAHGIWMFDLLAALQRAANRPAGSVSPSHAG